MAVREVKKKGEVHNIGELLWSYYWTSQSLRARQLIMNVVLRPRKDREQRAQMLVQAMEKDEQLREIEWQIEEWLAKRRSDNGKRV